MREGKRKTKSQPTHPKASRQTRMIERQQLSDLGHQMNMDLGHFLVLLEEGTSEQIDEAKQKAKNNLIKFGPDMQKLAEHIGGTCPSVVEHFLDSIDIVLHSAAGWVDEAMISHCYNAAQKLEKELSA
jgi:hypothetical protein